MAGRRREDDRWRCGQRHGPRHRLALGRGTAGAIGIRLPLCFCHHPGRVLVDDLVFASMTMLLNHLLSITVWFPILGGVMVLATGGNDERAVFTRWFSLVLAVCTFALTLLLYIRFDHASAGM